ncbi:hypothetical protein QQA43_30460 (plasmid) [Mycolicibacterium vanbaalenii]|nr:hypothetical protein [Mycolicibacterium vanbaalenii]WND60171.1 hypothetical protein QQA43_30460 [Mycolicibacterium vanbaalenii]
MRPFGVGEAAGDAPVMSAGPSGEGWALFAQVAVQRICGDALGA